MCVCVCGGGGRLFATPKINYKKFRADYYMHNEFSFFDSSVHSKDWVCCCKCGALATSARLGDLAGLTRARQYQSFERLHTHCFGKFW